MRGRNFGFKKANIRLWTIVSLLIVTPLGFLSKLYQGPAKWWFNDYSGDILYEIFWCLFFFLFFPDRKAVKKIPVWVFLVTCGLEFLQLWQPPFLQQIRATFWGKIFLGTTFTWWDFPHYIVGSILGWLWLRKLWKISYLQGKRNEETS